MQFIGTYEAFGLVSSTEKEVNKIYKVTERISDTNKNPSCQRNSEKVHNI